MKDEGIGSKPTNTIDKPDVKNADAKKQSVDNIIANNKTITAKSQQANPHKIAYKKKGKLKATNSGGETETISEEELQSNKKSAIQEKASNAKLLVDRMDEFELSMEG